MDHRNQVETLAVRMDVVLEQLADRGDTRKLPRLCGTIRQKHSLPGRDDAHRIGPIWPFGIGLLGQRFPHRQVFFQTCHPRHPGSSVVFDHDTRSRVQAVPGFIDENLRFGVFLPREPRPARDRPDAVTPGDVVIQRHRLGQDQGIDCAGLQPGPAIDALRLGRAIPVEAQRRAGDQMRLDGGLMSTFGKRPLHHGGKLGANKAVPHEQDIRKNRHQ